MRRQQRSIRAVAMATCDNGKLHIVRTGRRNRYHLHAPEEKVEAPEEKVEAPLVLIKDKLPEDAPMFRSEHSECDTSVNYWQAR